MQAQMKRAIDEINSQVIDLEKQLLEAKKNKADPDSIKELEDQIAMLKKQLVMMQNLTKGLSSVSATTFQQAADEGKQLVPARDAARINRLPKNIFTNPELLNYLQKLHAEVETLMLPAERAEAIRVYRNVRDSSKSLTDINNAAVGCWVYGHWEKALWLSGKACLDDMSDPDNLNNYAAFLTMIRGEHAAIPILRFLNRKYPDNSTVLNNLGQAWFGLGDISTAKKYLDSATIQFPNHSTANGTLSTIYLHQQDSVQAIAALRRSLRSCFSVEKAAALEGLGEELDDDDIEFDYPMSDDPFGLEPFFNEFPATPGSIAETPRAIRAWEAFEEAAGRLYEEAYEREDSAQQRTAVFIRNMSDAGYNEPVLRMHNSTVYYKAARKLPLAIKKKSAISINEIMLMMADAFHNVTTNRLNALEARRKTEMVNANECHEVEAVENRFMSDAKVIIDEGRAAMKQVYLQHRRKVDKFLKLTGYSSVNDYNQSMQLFHDAIWKKHQWIFTYTAQFTSVYRNIQKRPKMGTRCNEDLSREPTQTKQLPTFKTPDCPHESKIELTIGEIKEVCNTCAIDESKLKFRPEMTQKGEVQIGDGASSTAAGPQKQESLDPAKTSTMECNKSGSVKIDRARATRSQRCTVNSDRSSAGGTGPVGSMGGRLQMR